VTVAWTSPAHDDVVVTWTEDGDVRDRVDIVRMDGAPPGAAPTIVEAGQPNRSPLPGKLSGSDVRITVTVIDEAGKPVSEAGSSPVFDMDPPPKPVLRSVAPREDGTVRMSWVPGTAKDDTPGDPLDYDPGTPRFLPIAADPDFNATRPLAKASTATSFTVAATQKYPTYVGVWAEPNFWGLTGDAVEVAGTEVNASFPRSATIGAALRVTGTVTQLHRACDPGPCWAMSGPDAGRVVTLQSRARAGAAWATVATAKTTSKGVFRFLITFPGARDYRVIAAPVAYPAQPAARVFAGTRASTIRAVASGSDGGPSLPITGAPIARTAAAGGLLVLFGIALAGAARRRSRAGGRKGAEA
jgi:hypothetical protein